MRAAYIERLGPPAGIVVGELDEPRPGPTDVLVEVRATAVNPVDTFVRSGLFRTAVPFPFVVGRDLVGVVAAVGAGVSRFAVGERVWCNSLGHGGRQGAASERAVVPVDRLYRLPDAVADPGGAVAVLHPGATAHLALFTHGGLRAGETVLVAGAAGNVGGALVAFAAEAGARVVAVAAARDAEHCRARGASATVAYDAPDPAARIRDAAPSGVDLWLDASGGNDLATAVDLLAHRGRIVLLAGARTRPVLPAGELYMKDASVRGFVISHATTAELADAARGVNRLLAAGALTARAVRRLPLDAAARAHERLEHDTGGPRQVLIPDG